MKLEFEWHKVKQLLSCIFNLHSNQWQMNFALGILLFFCNINGLKNGLSDFKSSLSRLVYFEMDLRFISKWITFVFLWGTESRTLWRRTDWLAYFGMRGIPTFPSCWTKETKPCSAGFAIFAMLHVWHWRQRRWKPHMKQGSLLTSSHFHAGSEGLFGLFFPFSCVCAVCVHVCCEHMSA